MRGHSYPAVVHFRALPLASLTQRERQIVKLIQQAKSNKEIAYELRLTVGTVKEYLYRIFRKLEVNNRTELALRANSVSAEAAMAAVGRG